MSKINNAANAVNNAAEVNRAQIEHRATWMALIYDELKKSGIDAEKIIRAAIRRCGEIHGEAIKKRCAAPNDAASFKDAFLNSLVIDTFDMRPISAEKDSLNIDFHYCALVSAWKKLGFDDKTCALLCDIAMEGDRGIASVMGLKLDLQTTIASGCEDCKLRFKK